MGENYWLKFQIILKRASLWLFCCSLAVGFTGDLLGCRYNVRETGFVDFGLDRYILYLQLDDNQKSGLMEKWEAPLNESNIVSVSDKSGINLEIPPGFGPVILFSPRKGHPPLDLTSTALQKKASSQSTDPDTIHSLIATALESPLRKQLIQSVARNYAVILLFKGSQESRNQMALESVERSIQKISDHLDYFPKPIAHGPAVISIEQEQWSSERILFWSLGIDQPVQDEPVAAVIFGRARWIGHLLKGSEINEDLVFRILAIIGADCECGIDPKLLRGTPLPVRWHARVQTQVADQLGFDPDNPLVKTEVSQILRLRSRLFSEFTTVERRNSRIDDIPVPFIEDSDQLEPADSPYLWLLYLFGIVMAGVLLIGFLILFRSRIQ